MTKTLTEQWRNEELPIDLYYVIDKLGRETIGNDCGIRDMMVDAFNGGNIFIKEVLEPVPSYDEWKQAKENIDKNGTWYTERSYKRLEKKLEIATKALKSYEDKQNWDIRGVSFMKYNKGFTIARKALKDMEEV